MTTHAQLRKNDVLRPCPFCGGTEQELCNTHMPYYWIACACGAEVSGKSYGTSGRVAPTEKHHRQAATSAIRRWNTRAGEAST